MTVRESTTGFAEPAFHYIHADRRGSANVVLRANGSTVHSDSFGAFGEPRSSQGFRTGVRHPTAGDADFRTPPVLRRGFTDHEHLASAVGQQRCRVHLPLQPMSTTMQHHGIRSSFDTKAANNGQPRTAID